MTNEEKWRREFDNRWATGRIHTRWQAYLTACRAREAECQRLRDALETVLADVIAERETAQFYKHAARAATAACRAREAECKRLRDALVNIQGMATIETTEIMKLVEAALAEKEATDGN